MAVQDIGNRSSTDGDLIRFLSDRKVIDQLEDADSGQLGVCGVRRLTPGVMTRESGCVPN